jgi:hypothetical protein
LAGALSARAEIIDRVAVTVDKIVITESDIVTHIRIASFLNNEPVDLSPTARRDATDRLVDQVLVRREMEISRYRAPSPEDVDPVLDELLRQRALDEEGYEQALEQFGITDTQVRESLLQQLTLLRFIELRFRPGVALTDEEVESYYKGKFLEQWSRDNSAPVPALDDIRDEIEEVLIQEHVDEALDRWLEQAANDARIRIRQEVFR